MMFEESTERHWLYIKKLLEIHKENSTIINKIAFHYKTAMIHGYGHGWEDAMKKRLHCKYYDKKNCFLLKSKCNTKDRKCNPVWVEREGDNNT